ncbi:MAG TPA: SBBP repeat-containing protein [Polyangiaceae bacterium]
MRHGSARKVIRTGGLGLALSLSCGLGLVSTRSARAEHFGEAAANTNQTGPSKIARASSSLRFEPNVGQFEPQVRYVARGRSYALFLTDDGPTLALHRRTAAPSAPSNAGDGAQVEAVVTMRLKGASPVEPRGTLRLDGRSNYFVGKDRSSWRSDVEAYARVRYESVLPGVDVEYYGTEGRELEYDFSLAPGVAPSRIELELEGVSRIEIAPDGRAVLHLRDGSQLIKEPPIAYQEHNGRRMPVAAKYELRGEGLGFAVGRYDAALPLVIDPVLTYSSYFGGSSYDEACAIAADTSGNMYLVGYTASTLFPTSSPEQPTHAGGSYDAFVVKLNAAGTSLIYATYLGGNGPDIAYAVATDGVGNAYLAGLTSSTNFPVVTPVQAALGGSQDAFVTKLNSSGSAIVYSTYLGGALDDYVKGIAVTSAGAVYLVGTTFSTNFPVAAPLQASLSGTYDAFVTQLTPAGTSLVYSTYLGGTGTEYGNAIALDSLGNAYVVGSTTSSNFPTLNARQSSHAGGGTDAFLSKLNTAGTGFVYSTYLGGSGADEALGVTVAVSTPVVVGDTLSGDFPLVAAAQRVPGGNNHSDAFITHFEASGTTLAYSTYLGGTGNDSAVAVASDSSGDVYVVGQTDSADLPLQQPIDGQESYHGAGDAFVAALPTAGSRFAYTSYLGGAAADRGAGIALAAGATYVAGNTLSSDFPKVAPIINGLVGSQDAFVAKLPSIQSASAAPALGWRSLLLMAGLLLGVAVLLLNTRGPTRYRNAR